MRDFNECRCHCHSDSRTGSWTGHCFGPCCNQCPWCRKNVAFGFKEHERKCEEEKVNGIKKAFLDSQNREPTEEEMTKFKGFYFRG